MKKLTFRFKCSYRNEVNYSVFGDDDCREIEEYRPLGWLEETEKKYYNGTPGEYAADVEARIGGVANRTGSYRMSYPVWQEYINWNVQTHREQVAEIKSHPEKYGDYTPEPLAIPRPIFWNHELKTWSVEPWFVGEQTAA